MVAIPRVKYGLAFSVRYASRSEERALSVVGFAERIVCSMPGSRRCVAACLLFRADYHAVTPCHRRTDGYFL